MLFPFSRASCKEEFYFFVYLLFVFIFALMPDEFGRFHVLSS